MRGSLVALVTPMLDDGEVDFGALGELIDWHINAGTDGLVVLGTTGESALLSDAEQQEVLKFSLEKVNRRIPVIVGCGGVSTEKTLAMAKAFNQLKPDGFLCVTPYYVKPGQRGMVQHFKALANTCESPVILYNVPGRTGVDLGDESIRELAKHPNIVGIKDATADIARAKPLFESVEDFVFLSGDDETAFDFVSNGGDGVISVTANVAPAQMKMWLDVLGQGKVAEAKCLFEQLLPLHQELFVEANPIPVKWALWELGKIKSGIRLPLTWASENSQARIRNALSTIK